MFIFLKVIINYIDFGSAIEIITKGFSTLSYINNGKNSYLRCESFYIKNHIPVYIE